MSDTSIRRLRKLVEGLADQQAMPDDSWKAELAEVEAALTTLAKGYEEEADRLLVERVAMRKELETLAKQIREEDARILTLAKDMAGYIHHSGYPVYDGGHSEPENQCQHPDCAAIRARQEK